MVAPDKVELYRAALEKLASETMTPEMRAWMFETTKRLEAEHGLPKYSHRFAPAAQPPGLNP